MIETTASHRIQRQKRWEELRGATECLWIIDGQVSALHAVGAIQAMRDLFEGCDERPTGDLIEAAWELLMAKKSLQSALKNVELMLEVFGGVGPEFRRQIFRQAYKKFGDERGGK